MEKSAEKSVSSSASGNLINSKLRYPLRSTLRSKEGKPPVPDFSGSSVPKRGRVASAVSQSTTVLDLSAKKSDDLTKPPRRRSIPSKTRSNSSVKSVTSSVTSLSESKPKKSNNARILYESPVSNTLRSGKARSLYESPLSNPLRSGTRKKVEDLSSSTYWLAHIKLSESMAKHSISLGFFKLALHARCEPIDKMKEELKSYCRRNNMDGLEDAMKELSELYNISEESKQMQNSETNSIEAEETTVSLNAQSSFFTLGDSNITSETTKDCNLQDSAVTETVKEEETSETRSLVNQENVSEVIQDKKPEIASKNNQLMKTRKSLATKSANSRTIPENKDDKSQKKSVRITKPKKIQEETKKSTRKSTVKVEMKNKENSIVVDAEEEIQV